MASFGATDARDQHSAQQQQQQQQRSKKLYRPFTREVRTLMYGFGDTDNPSPDSVDLMEELLLTYLSDLVTEAQRTAPKPKTSDFLHALRRDPKKLARAHELLAMEVELNNARKVFHDPEMDVKKRAAGAAGGR
ncbi:transcription initiation factor IID, 18kD subunit-domain-containing protein [Fimicolochytrium jonesii]|uniref:transcription initiation factor IID, 18kD subunit-domain-containing protein n=1 Tax=Fimicolochytrium jonesii TaxID=1396493 RepID=UPI0022FE0D41|nr:transcription initiation factor IID, 18kD subunit-domain-containing protein [Fimicolochytrium jonesii]KAI8826886.1 transcription initiation factor IID, 18kD subunit-domain-containing protein [Fimicolochytrium jonesii]